MRQRFSTTTKNARPDIDGGGDYYCYRADVWGDSCEELVISARNGVPILANSRPLAIATLYNSTTYNGM